jgi:hypothetical protein
LEGARHLIDEIFPRGNSPGEGKNEQIMPWTRINLKPKCEIFWTLPSSLNNARDKSAPDARQPWPHPGWLVGLERSPTFQPFPAGRFRSSTVPTLQKHVGWIEEFGMLADLVRNSRRMMGRFQRGVQKIFVNSRVICPSLSSRME